jgi:hypothetical protein
MKVNRWTLGLAAVGLVSLPAVVQAEEKMSTVGTALASTVISGYVNTSARWDLGSGNGAGGASASPAYIYGGAGKADGFNLDLVKVSLEKPLDEAQWAAGYRIDFQIGPDAAAFGNGAIRQAYVALRAPVGNGLDLKVGVFDSIVGYESHDAGNNPNYTRSYAATFQPHTHEGVLASYQFNEMFGASVGVANTLGPGLGTRATGAFSGVPNESYKTYMASLAFTAPQSWGWAAGSTAYLGLVNGDNPGAAAPGVNVTHWYLGLTLATPVTGLRAGLSYDYAGSHRDTAAGIPSTHRWATAVYASYQATEKLSTHLRGEYFSQSALLTGPGLPSDVIAFTGTIQYDLWQNVISRLELRWDHSAGKLADNPLNGGRAYGGKSVTDTGRKDNFTVAANIIYKF